jgi:hypothetical protein
MTQRDRVFNHLIKYKNGITSMEAIERYGITRLACVISCLKREGIKIDSKIIPVKNRYGEVVYVSRYTIGE